MTQTSHTFRIFVSSTFSDLKAERNALQEKVFPRLRDLALSHGCRFQVIDLRWGVSEEAALDQQTMKVCLGEIERCQKTSPRPNFIVLLGDRYGWRPLPYEVPASEFEVILPLTSKEDQTFLEQWYLRDNNALPPVYVLQPRSGEFEKFEIWEKVEAKLRSIFLSAIGNLNFSPDALLKYTASATEQEIVAGALKVPDAKEHVFCFLRGIQNISEDHDSAVFYEADPQIARMQSDLKDHLREKLSDNVHEYTANWQDVGPSLDHLDLLCDDVYNRLSQVISAEAAQIKKTDSLDHEIDNHKLFAAERSHVFVGRAEILNNIEKYIKGTNPQPLVVWGASGSGKSALMAKAIDRAQKNEQGLIYRFIGVTPESSNGRMLLECLCRQISRFYGADENTIPFEYKDLVLEFPKRLALAKPDKPLILFLDALDQLSDTDNARNLIWLPAKLPSNVRLIVTTLEGECLNALKGKTPEQDWIQVQSMPANDGSMILESWLKGAGRTLQENQESHILEKFANCGLPLYLKLAFEEARLWKSFDPLPELSEDIPGMIRGLFNRLSEESNHGGMMVSRALGYLVAAKNGLSEDELIDVLSLDEEVLADFRRRSPKSPQSDRLPVVVWSRLYFDLEPYLTERSADDTSLLAFFHTTSFRAVITENYLLSENKIKRHRLLANYMETRWNQSSMHALNEFPYHLQEIQNWEKLANFLTNPHFIQDYCLYIGHFDLLPYSEICLQQIESQDELAIKLVAVNETLSNFNDLLAREPQTFLQQLYLVIIDHWSTNTFMIQWSEQILSVSTQKITFSIVGGIHSPQSPLFRNLGIQNDFIQEIKTTPNFECLFSATFSGQLRCFNVVSGSIIGEQFLNDVNVLSMINIDKNNILLGLSNGNIIKWDGKTEITQIYTVSNDYSVNSLVFNPETRILYIGPGQWKSHPQSGKLYMLNLDNCKDKIEQNLDDRIVWFYEDVWKQKRLINPNGVQINQMILRPNSSEIGFAFHHGEVSLFDRSNGKWRCVLTNNGNSIYSIAFTRDGDHLLIAESIDNNNSGQLIDFNLVSWSVNSTMQFPQPLTAMVFNNKTQEIFLGDWSGMLYIINHDDMTIQNSFPTELSGTVRSLCCDSSGQLLAVSGRGIRIFAINGKKIRCQKQNEWHWNATRGHGSGSSKYCVITSHSDGDARCISIESMQTINTAPLKYVQSANQASLAIGEKLDGSIEIFSLPDFTDVMPITIPGLQIIHGIGLDNQGHFAACMFSDENGVYISIHKVDSERAQTELIRNYPILNRPGLFMPMIFSKNSELMAAVTSQCAFFPDINNLHKVEFHLVNVDIFNIDNGGRRNLSVDSPIGSLALSSNGEYLYVGSGTQYEFRDNPEQSFLTEARQTNFQPSSAYSIRKYLIKDGVVSNYYKGHTDSVNTLTLSPDEKYLCSTSDDHTLRLWDVQNQECLGLIGFDGRPLWVSFTKKDREIVVAYSGWRVDKRVILKTLKF